MPKVIDVSQKKYYNREWNRCLWLKRYVVEYAYNTRELSDWTHLATFYTKAGALSYRGNIYAEHYRIVEIAPREIYTEGWEDA